MGYASLAFASLVAVVLAATGIASAQSSPSQIWDEPLAIREPFDSQPFRPVKVPAWLQETTRYVFMGIDEASASKASACGADMAPLGIGGTRYVNYPSDLLPMNPAVAADTVAQQIATMQKHKLRIIAAIPPRLQAVIYAKHPDWRSKDSPDQKLPEFGPDEEVGGGLCMMGPWGDYLIDALAEFLTRYPQTDGFSFDGIHNSGACYCEHCMAAYRKDTGKTIPPRNMNDPEFRRYQYWLDRRMESVVERMQVKLKGIKPDVTLVTWTTNAGRFGHFRDIPRNMPARMNLLFDSPGQEFWLDETNRGNTVVPAFANAYIWAVTNHREAHSEPYIMSHGNPYGTDSFPRQEMVRRSLLAVAHGAQAAISMGWPGLADGACDVLKELTAREPWLSHKQPEAWAALVMSDNTRTFYGRDPGNVEERYMSNVLGMFRATLEEHLPVTVINDWNLNPKDLAKYKVLILPNTACLMEDQAKAIRQFVENGGGLVATVDTSLFDEMGNPREDFLLADVFGVSYRGVPASGGGQPEEIDVNFAKGIDAGYWEKRKSIFDFKPSQELLSTDARLKELLGDRPVTFKGQAVAVQPVDASARQDAVMTAREPGAAAVPAVVTRQFGKGRVAYIAAGLDSAYYLYPYPYERIVLASAIRSVAPQEFPISVEAPMCVHTSYFRQKNEDGERLIVHLYNDLNSTANHARPDDDVPLREEVIPLSGIKVRFSGYNLGRIHLEPGGTDLKPVRTDGGLEVTVPRLDIHSMVVAELKG